MPAVRTTTRVAPTTTRKSTRTPAKAAGTDDDRNGEEELVKGMERVLKISQPQESTARTRRTAVKDANTVTGPLKPTKPPAVASRSTSAARTSSKSAAASSSKQVPVASSSKRTVVRTTITTKMPPTSSVPLNKGKTTENDLPSMEKLHISNQEDAATSSLQPVERARLAMQAINSSLKSLTAAIQSGHQYGSTSGSSSKDKRPDTSDDIWTDERIVSLVETCEAALVSLRHLEEQGDLPGKAIEIERAAQGLVGKCIRLEMYRRALDQLRTARPSILRLYMPISFPPSPVQATAGAKARSNPGPSRSGLSATSSRATTAPPDASKRQPSFESWKELAWLPSPRETSKMADEVKGIAYQALIAAWIALIALHSSEVNEESFPLPVRDGQLETRLHPLRLAMEIPQAQVTSLMQLLSRRLSTLEVTPSTKRWLHIRLLTLTSFSTIVQPAPEGSTSKQVPQQVWETCHRTVSFYVSAKQDENQRAEDGSTVIGSLVGWVEAMVQHRRGQTKEWFQGPAWTTLMDLWISLGRRLADSSVIDRAMSLMASDTPNLATPPRSCLALDVPCTPTSQPSRSSRGSKRSARGKHQPHEAQAEVIRRGGDLAKTTLALDKYLAESTAMMSATAESSINSIDMVALAEALVNLEDSDSTRASLAKAVRAIERTRRSCVKILERIAAESAESSLLTAVRKGLVSGVELVEEVLSDSSISLSEVAQDLVAGAVDSLVALARHPPRLGGDAAVARTTLSYLSRAHDMTQMASTQVDKLELADWLRCLSAAAYNNGTKLWRNNRFREAQSSVELGCMWGKEALSLAGNENSIVWAQVREHLPKKYELLAFCQRKDGDTAGGLRTYCDYLSSLPLSITTPLADLSGSVSVTEAFVSASDVEAALSRLAFMIMNDPILMPISKVLDDMTTAQVPCEAVGLVGERLFILLNEGQHRSEIAQVALDLGRAIMGVYNATEFPIRRMRMLTRLMALISASGVETTKFDGYAQELDALNTVGDAARDASLLAHRPELHATALLIQAIHAYHTESEPTQTVLDSATQAMHELRAMIIPPSPSPVVVMANECKRKPLGHAATTRAPPRAPVKSSRIVSEPKTVKAISSKATIKTTSTEAPERSKRRSSVTRVTTFEDLPRTASLLGALASLLGLLGHVLPKVEALKVLRSLLRGREDFIDEYVSRSAELAAEYAKLGKISRATTVFSQTIRFVTEAKKPASAVTRVELHLLHSAHLARTGHAQKSQEDFTLASALVKDVESLKNGSLTARVLDRCSEIERVSLAHQAIGAIDLSQDDTSSALNHLNCNFRLCARAADAICRLAPEIKSTVDLPPAKDEGSTADQDDPFAAPAPVKKVAGQDEPAKDDAPTSTAPQAWTFTGRRLHTLQFHIAENLLSALFDLAKAFAQRGTVRECEYYLKQAEIVATATKSSTMVTRAKTQLAHLQYRLRRLEKADSTIEEASTNLAIADGPDAIEIERLRGELLARHQETEQANELFVHASADIGTLDTAFTEAEALITSPRKSIPRVSASASMNLASSSRKETLLATSLAQILRQQVWLFRDAECLDESRQIEAQLRSFAPHDADDLYFEGRVGLHDALERFKTDLFMSSLTESTIAMPMRKGATKSRDRQSARHTIQVVLQASERAFLSALTTANNRGRVEDVRQACVSLALLRAFQTSLGEGSTEVTLSVANLLASTSSITFQRELVEAIDGKFLQGPQDDLKWPEVSTPPRLDQSAPLSPTRPAAQPLALVSSASSDDDTRSQWSAMKAKYSSDFLSYEHCDLSSLPAHWAVVSIHVSEDRNTMFLSRHQRGHEPLVFVTPLDRQGRRDGDEDTFTFDDAISEFEGIIKASDDSSRNTKDVTTREAKIAWWDTRRALDKQLGELLEKIEYFWLGAFKTILNPRSTPAMTLRGFGAKLEKIFSEALAGAGRDVKKGVENPLTDELLECFATLSSKSKEEEIEDLVWFILDLYQFYGVPIAPDDLDIDQLAVDVKGALVELETASRPITPADNPEHLFLALDKNVQGLPWESLPILRGRPVSRIPSLPFLVDQVSLGRHLSSSSSNLTADARVFVNSRKVFYVLNPSGDLDRTQAHFEDWLAQMVSKAGWKGIVGRPPTELELAQALESYDLVLYFGHGGAEQYIRSHKVRHLSKCATTMLWGCSSGLLHDQGDLDRTGTAWSYMMAGCPSLVANLWDVTDRDIDRLSREVLQKLNLDASHMGSQGARQALLPISPLSMVEAVNTSRDECKMKYLTGAAPVVYGLPVYLR